MTRFMRLPAFASAAFALLFLPLAFAPMAPSAQAQTASGDITPPKILVVDVEDLKPGTNGAMHEATESLFVQAATAAHSPMHYLGMDAMSGAPRAVFMFGYDSFAEMEHDNKIDSENPELSKNVNVATAWDGQNLSASGTSIWTLRPELSIPRSLSGSIANDRYMEASIFVVKEGHGDEWSELVKTYMDAVKKAEPDMDWAMYELAFGDAQGPTFVMIHSMKSLSQEDAEFSADKQIHAAIGEENFKKIRMLESDAIASEHNNLYAFNPRLSYLSTEWTSQDKFWTPTPTVDQEK